MPHSIPRKIKKSLKRKIIASLPESWPEREIKHRVRLNWRPERGWEMTLRPRRRRFKVIRSDAVLDVPASVQLCPYCNAKLTVRFEEWTAWRGRYWKAGSVVVECGQEPDIDSDQWEEHWASHSQMPYVYWLPAQKAVERWVNGNFVFEMDE